MARDFESGSSQYLECATTPITAVDLSISAWMKIETATPLTYICGIYDLATDLNWFGLRIGGAGPGVQATTNQTTESVAVTSTNVTTGVWQHACATFGPTAGTDRAAYLNGAGKGTQTTNKVPAGLDRVTIGSRGSATRAGYFDGLIAEVTIWNVQLTDAEVEALANRAHSLTIRPGNVVAYWPLYGIGSPEPNLATSSLNMTVTGATLSDQHPPVAPFPPADISFVPVAVAAVTYNDTVAGTIPLSGTATETLAHAATTAGTVPLSGSATESYVLAEYVRPRILVAPSVPVTRASRY